MLERNGRRAAILMAFLAVLLLAPARVAVACTCAHLPPGDPVELAGRHSEFFDHAFIGVIDRIADPVETDPGSEGYAPGSYVPYIVSVEAHLAGETEADRVIVLQQSRPEPGDLAPDCAYGFAPGGRYLIEAHGNPDGTFLTNGCGFVQPYGAGALDATTTSTRQGRPPPAQADGGSDFPLATAAGIATAVLVIGGALLLTLALRRRSPGPEPVRPPSAFGPGPMDEAPGPPPPGTGQGPPGPTPPPEPSTGPEEDRPGD